MNESKTFLKGVALGVAIMLAVGFVFTGLQGAWGRQNGAALAPDKKIEEIVGVLDRYYVDEFKREEMLEAMYTGLVYGVGDPYTSYMDKDSLVSFKEQTSGKYAGIGVVVTVDMMDNRIKVVSPFEGSPGARAGILPGDKIMKVNGFDVYADAYEEVVAMLKGKPGTAVNITLYRADTGKTFDVDVVRENINVPTVSHKMLEDDIGYLRISGFERVTYGQFMEAYDDLTANGMRGLIIDVRNNPGGLLDVVIKIADELVPKGYIVYTEDKSGKKEFSYSNDKRVEVPLAILVNENSASASEVLSGAVQDMKAGVLVGVQTFGKGLVQNLFELSDGSAVKVTVAKYYTPSGICINGEGLTPDYVVEMDKDKTVSIASLSDDEDAQLQKAVEVITEQMN